MFGLSNITYLKKLSTSCKNCLNKIKRCWVIPLWLVLRNYRHESVTYNHQLPWLSTTLHYGGVLYSALLFRDFFLLGYSTNGSFPLRSLAACTRRRSQWASPAGAYPVRRSVHLSQSAAYRRSRIQKEKSSWRFLARFRRLNPPASAPVEGRRAVTQYLFLGLLARSPSSTNKWTPIF